VVGHVFGLISGPLEGTLVQLCHVSSPVYEILHVVGHVFGLIDKIVGILVMYLACYTRQRTYSAMLLDRWLRPWRFCITYSSH